MIERGSGVIVNNSSGWGIAGGDAWRLPITARRKGGVVAVDQGHGY